MKKLRLGLLIILTLFTVSCATTGQRASSEDDVQQQNNVDPWEGFNRKMYAFNAFMDKWLLKPVAKGYDYVLPDFVQVGVGNFFSNIGEVGNIGNDILQWKWKEAGVDSGRLIVNSTLGVAGLFDVASNMGLQEDDGEDMGQTLEAWGVKSGPYIVLPFFGPSTVREAFAMPVDAFMDPVNYVDDDGTRLGLWGTRLVHQRYELFDLEESISGAGDEYLFVRDAYLQRRQYLYNDGLIEDSFEDDFGDEDF